jgi:phosphatidylinositol alpha-1,6-mannosyltransferase
MPPVKVLWVTERFPPDRGGAAVSAARQVAGLAAGLERLDLLCLTGSLAPGRVSLEETGTLRIHRVGRAPGEDESLQLLSQTAQNLLGAHRHDLVHGFYAVHAGYVAVMAARQAGARSVVSLRGNDLDRAMFHGPRLPFLLWTLRHADRLAVLSDEMRRKVRALADREDQVRIVPNGVDAELFRPDGPAPDFPGAPRPWLGFSGELRLKKGLPLLEDLAELMAARGTGTLFWIGGRRRDDPGSGPPPRVREIPYVQDPARVASICRAMDLLVFPSLWDGMPNALLEAMACGRPVLASSVGAIPEVVRPGVDGFLLPAQRLHEFAVEALRIAALPPEELRRIGAAARDRVIRGFTPAAEREALLDLYRSLAP